jgi:hypothetical protein
MSLRSTENIKVVSCHMITNSDLSLPDNHLNGKISKQACQLGLLESKQTKSYLIR